MLTHGYVGLGFSNNGRMKGSDIVIGWIKEDSTPFLDVSLVIRFFDKICSFDIGHKNSKFTRLFFIVDNAMGCLIFNLFDDIR